MDSTSIAELVAKQQRFFSVRRSFDVTFRREALRTLRASIHEHEQSIYDALQADLGKSAQESYMCEIGLVLSEINYLMGHMRTWAEKKHVATDLVNFHAKSYTVAEPLGTVLVMAPWNYPFLLTLEPLAGAIAAGNTVVVKPSAYAPNCSRVLREIIEESFDPGYIAVVEGGRAENAALLDQSWDHIFFTGSPTVGKLVMEKASAHLTPVTLELGGKSPAIVDETANIKRAAQRIAWGKFLNCGQTCVAPDYVLVHEQVHDKLVEALKQEIVAQYGENPLANYSYGKIINEKHYERVKGLIDASKVAFGGAFDDRTLRIAPTILTGVTPGDACMGEEIFGPVLPILSFTDIDEAEAFVWERPKPLAFYLFTRNAATEKRFVRFTQFGGGCINDCVVHLIGSRLPFGGVGASGMGKYHGKASFDTFSNVKSVVKKYNWLETPIRTQPYSKLKLNLIKILLH